MSCIKASVDPRISVGMVKRFSFILFLPTFPVIQLCFVLNHGTSFLQLSMYSAHFGIHNKEEFGTVCSAFLWVPYFICLLLVSCLMSLSVHLCVFFHFTWSEQEFLRSIRARRRYWARSYAGWRRFTASQPGPAHRALASLENMGHINFMITQNVDRYSSSNWCSLSCML